ncbi:MAG: ADP-ribosylglycohydrolase family protein [Lentisphaeria bacterium]|nr:ADP-ribosylglycohydrolase family protein [Lentisphaeria bacterium]
MSGGPIPNSYWVVKDRLAAGEYPGAVSPDEARPRLRQFLAAGIRVFLDLTEEGELVPYAPFLKEEADRLGIEAEWIRLAIPDVSVPQVSHMRRILAAIREAMDGGSPVYVHCWGGVGRTGTVVGCHLVESGLSGPEALKRLADLWQNVEKRWRRPRTPETKEQEEFVLNWKPAARQETAPSRAERIRGCLLGGAVGDALGAPVEFLSLRDIRSRFGAEGIAGMVPAYGRAGAITDDTQMTLWTVEGLLRGECRGTNRGIVHLPSVVHHAYLRWLKSQGTVSRDKGFGAALEEDSRGWLFGVDALHSRRAPGNTCLAALASAGMATMESPKNDSKGCGGVMRVAPVGLYKTDPEPAFALACEIAAITHGHPTGYLASGCFAAIVACIARGNGLREAVGKAMDILAGKPGHGETTSCLEKAIALLDSGAAPVPETVERIGQGWVAEEALAIAVFAALAFPDDFRRCVLLAVNHGGDSDSTGAIVGNILGALLGTGSIPSEWLAALELRDEIETLAVDLHVRYRDDEEWWRKYPGC